MMLFIGFCLGGIAMLGVTIAANALVYREYTRDIMEAEDLISQLEEEIEERDERFDRMLPKRGPDGRFVSSQRAA